MIIFSHSDEDYDYNSEVRRHKRKKKTGHTERYYDRVISDNELMKLINLISNEESDDYSRMDDYGKETEVK